jgi:hypothetical protein
MTSKITVEAHCVADKRVIVVAEGAVTFLVDGAKKEYIIHDEQNVFTREVTLEDAQSCYEWKPGAGMDTLPPAKPAPIFTTK